jgi:hypothetical protein
MEPLAYSERKTTRSRIIIWRDKPFLTVKETRQCCCFKASRQKTGGNMDVING